MKFQQNEAIRLENLDEFDDESLGSVYDFEQNESKSFVWPFLRKFIANSSYEQVRVQQNSERSNYWTKTTLAVFLCSSCVLLLVVLLIQNRVSVKLDKTVTIKSSVCWNIPNPPIAMIIPFYRNVHNETILDNFNWMSFQNYTAVLNEYVANENNYTIAIMNHTINTQIQIQNEIRPLLERAIVKFDRFWQTKNYFYFIDESTDFPIYGRWPITSDTSQSTFSLHGFIPSLISGQIFNYPDNVEIILNVTDFAASADDYLTVGVFEVSPDESLVAFSLDRKGNEKFDLYFSNITAKKVLWNGLWIPNTYYKIRWAGNSHVFYQVLDEMVVPRFIDRFCVICFDNKYNNYLVGQRVYNEHDGVFIAELDSSNDFSFIFIIALGQITSEVFPLPSHLASSDVLPTLLPLFNRTNGVIYNLEHRFGIFYIRTNYGNANNFQILRCPVVNYTITFDYPELQVFFPSSPNIFIEKIEVFENYLLGWIWDKGLSHIQIIPFSSKLPPYRLVFGNSASVYGVYPGTVPDMDVRLYRDFNLNTFLFTNFSYIHPRTTYEHNVITNTTRIISFEESLSYDINDYVEYRMVVNSYDDSPITINLMFRRNDSIYIPVMSNSIIHYKPTVPMPVSVRCYGSYGTLENPIYNPAAVIPLLNRNVAVIALTVRGDQNYGASYYEHGKAEWKFNSCLDVYWAIKWLVENGWAKRGSIGFEGRSAGGLLAGCATNFLADLNTYQLGKTSQNQFAPYSVSLRGDFYYPKMKNALMEMISRGINGSSFVNVVIMEVPFIDAIADMIDPTVPWVEFEWYEWGNPLNKTIYDAMMDYSPYENIRLTSFPSILVTSGFLDTRVNYYEPTKFVAKIRSKMQNVLSGTLCNDSNQKKTGKPVLLKVGNNGHFGSVGEEGIKELAFKMAFYLDNINK